MSFGKRGAKPPGPTRPARIAGYPAPERRAFAGDDLAPAVPDPAAAPPKRSRFPIILLAVLFVPTAMNWMMRGAQRDLEAQLGKPDANGLYPPVSGKLAPPKAATQEVRRDPPGKIVNAIANDPEIAAARAKARASLDTFWQKLAAPAAGEDNFTLKASLPTTKGSLEHIWVAEIKRNGDTVSGRLSNQPRDIAGLTMGSPVTFHEQQISDWSFRRNGKIVGNETMRPLIAKLPPAEAAQYRTMLETP